MREKYQVSLKTEVAKRAISDFRKAGLKGISFTGGGEPLVHKDFYEILSHAKGEGLDTGIMTNGALLTEERMEDILNNSSWIRISVGAGNRELYKKIHGKDDYEKVISNILMLAKIKQEKHYQTDIGVRMLIDEDNMDSLKTLADELKFSGINYLQIAPDCRDNSYPIMQTEAFKEVISESENILKEGKVPLLLAGFIKNQDQYGCPQRCYAHFYQVALIATGDIVFCKNARSQEDMVIGNVYTDTVENIWNGSRNIELENCIIPGEKCSESGFCKNMQVNVAIEEVLHPPEELSINFIG